MAFPCSPRRTIDRCVRPSGPAAAVAGGSQGASRLGLGAGVSFLARGAWARTLGPLRYAGRLARRLAGGDSLAERGARITDDQRRTSPMTCQETLVSGCLASLAAALLAFAAPTAGQTSRDLLQPRTARGRSGPNRLDLVEQVDAVRIKARVRVRSVASSSSTAGVVGVAPAGQGDLPATTVATTASMNFLSVGR